jgi:hypothetical protein
MKTLPALAILVAAGFSSLASSKNPLEQFSPHFSTNTEIRWQASTEHLPKSLWIYKRVAPQPFSPLIISNALSLASVLDKGIPEPSMKPFFIWSEPNPCGARHSIFSIQPESSTITYGSPNQVPSPEEVPSDEVVLKQAFECAARLGLDASQCREKNVYSTTNGPGCDQKPSDGVCGRGVFLSRIVDSLTFFGDANNNNANGFSIEFVRGRKIRSFCYVWPKLERWQICEILDRKEIVQCLWKHEVMLNPEDGSDYFESIKVLGSAKTFTITKITPYYAEGIFGQMPTNDVPQFIAPFAELEAVASFARSNLTVRILSPIIRPR